MTDPDGPNMVGVQLEVDDEGHIIGLAPPLPPVPEQVGTPIGKPVADPQPADEGH